MCSASLKTTFNDKIIMRRLRPFIARKRFFSLQNCCNAHVNNTRILHGKMPWTPLSDIIHAQDKRLNFEQHRSFSSTIKKEHSTGNNKKEGDTVSTASHPSPPQSNPSTPSNQNDLAENMEQVKLSNEKLRDVLNKLGMSLSQWNIKDNNFLKSDNSTSSSLPRRNRGEMKRLSEEFDIYNNLYGPRSRRLYKSSLMQENITARLRVRSVHAAQTIDTVSVLTKVFGQMSEMPAMRHMFGKTSVIIQLPSIQDDFTSSTGSSSSAKQCNDVDSFFHPISQPRFIAIFRFGSIVFFNICPKDASAILDKVKKHSIDPISRSFERKEHFEVAISPQMEQDAHVTSDFAMVKELNINNVAVISTIMAQTVAFDSYNDIVDQLLATFSEINSNVKKTGNFTAMQKETLFKVVAQNNSLLIDMLAKLGIKDRSDTAWNMSQYERIHEGMKLEFEIENRFADVEFKLNLIQQNAKFFLTILHNQKSDTLEWILILLIGFECILSIMDMSGVGASLFR